MILDVQVSAKTVAKLYRERDEYVLKYLSETENGDFVSLALPVREQPWRVGATPSRTGRQMQHVGRRASISCGSFRRR